MHNRRKQMLVMGLLVFTVVLTGVYALLSTNLNITGTTSGKGDFKIEFSHFSISDDAKATATLDADKTSINMDANLSYPGDTVTLNFTIKNTGSLKATVSDLVINNNSTEDFDIVINGLTDIKGTTLDVNETLTGSVVVTWKTAATNPNPESTNFDITLDYLQAT
ncbi:MAG: hypothetical protein PHN72_05615 [Bacilli bacterium]|nr:hypothetical protein [Bacilli bacterium]